ncbi:MAG: Gfo/Idh/MocA family oxidoreductase [Spirochaetes bacterium]|nr:Gfo/Idh/MocA family oxidoreductase [Spirochaetota bacterium]
MIRIGACNIDTSHPKAFADYLANGSDARYVGIFNDGFRGDDEVDGFIKKYGLEKRCTSMEELADMCDIVFIHDCNWDKHLTHALPVLKKGKPVFIDKPIVGNLADCRRIEALAKEGKVLLGSSSVRYAEEIVDFAAKSEADIGRVMNVFGTSGVDEFNYAVHIVEAFGGLLGTGAVSAQFAGRSSIGGKVCETFFVTFANGVTATYNTFSGTWQPFDVVIQTTKSTYHFRIDVSKIYAALLSRIIDFMKTGTNRLAPVPVITESVKIMLAARISRENGGRAVALADIPESDPGYSGALFEKEYAAAAKKMYV